MSPSHSQDWRKSSPPAPCSVQHSNKSTVLTLLWSEQTYCSVVLELMLEGKLLCFSSVQSSRQLIYFNNMFTEEDAGARLVSLSLLKRISCNVSRDWSCAERSETHRVPLPAWDWSTAHVGLLLGDASKGRLRRKGSDVLLNWTRVFFTVGVRGPETLQ